MSIVVLRLFTQNNVWVVEKLKCIIHYFKRVLDKSKCFVRNSSKIYFSYNLLLI